MDSAARRPPTIAEALALLGLVVVASVLGSPLSHIVGSPLLWVLTYQVALVGIPVALFVSARRKDLRIAIGWPTPLAAIASLALGASIALINVGLVIPNLPFAGDGPVLLGSAFEAPLALIIATLIIVPALVEECLFRGIVHSAFAAKSPLLGIVMSAFFFAGFHFSVAQMAPLFFLGLATGAVMTMRRNLACPILVHAANNAVVVALLILGPKAALPWTASAAAIVIAPIALIGMRALGGRLR